MYFTEALEKSLKINADVFDTANKMDVSRGGENFPMGEILKIFSTYKTSDKAMKGKTFATSSTKEFFETLEDCALNASNLKKSELIREPFATFKIDPSNYGKQKMLIEIVNTITNEKFGFDFIRSII
jgi:hypothetical protein